MLSGECYIDSYWYLVRACHRLPGMLQVGVPTWLNLNQSQHSRSFLESMATDSLKNTAEKKDDLGITGDLWSKRRIEHWEK